MSYSDHETLCLINPLPHLFTFLSLCLFTSPCLSTSLWLLTFLHLNTSHHLVSCLHLFSYLCLFTSLCLFITPCSASSSDSTNFLLSTYLPLSFRSLPIVYPPLRASTWSHLPTPHFFYSTISVHLYLSTNSLPSTYPPLSTCQTPSSHSPSLPRFSSLYMLLSLFLSTSIFLPLSTHSSLCLPIQIPLPINFPPGYSSPLSHSPLFGFSPPFIYVFYSALCSPFSYTVAFNCLWFMSIRFTTSFLWLCVWREQLVQSEEDNRGQTKVQQLMRKRRLDEL